MAVELLRILMGLCEDVNNEVVAQRSELHTKYPLAMDQILALTRCPGWPEEHVRAYAKRRKVWYARDVAADGLTGRELLVEDAVWLLVQPGVLDAPALISFLQGCCERARGYADGALAGVQGPDSAPPCHPHAPWSTAAVAYRECARELSKRRPRPETPMWCVFRASRVFGLAARALSTCEQVPSAAQQAALLTAEACPAGVRAEQRKQLEYLARLAGA